MTALPITDHHPDFTPNPELYPFESRWFESSVGRIHYLDEGVGRPILLMHGSEDDVVPVLASTEMKRVYDENDLVAEFELFEGEGHGFDGEAAIRSSDKAKAWFDRWLLADTPHGRSAETVESTPEPGEDP